VIAKNEWTTHVISDAVVGPMSLDVADMDGDGDWDVIVGEHNLSTPANARLLIFENTDGVGGSWTPHTVYSGDEHHDGDAAGSRPRGGCGSRGVDDTLEGEPLKTTRVTLVVAGVSLIIGIAGCASVDSDPFSQFAQGLGSLRDGTDAMAAGDVQNARERFVAEVRSGEISLLDLQLGFEAPFGYEYSFGAEPLYVKLGRFQQGMKALNDAMIAYADLLTKLAGGDVVDGATFDQLTTDLNANALSAAGALNLRVGGDDSALLTTAAVAAFRGVLEKKRRSGLAGAIREVQPQVDEYSRAMVGAIKFLATGVTTDYDDQFRAIIGPLAAEAGAAPVDDEVIERVLALNLQTQQTLGNLAALSASYQRLPAAHRDLVAAAGDTSGDLTGLISFTNEALRLHTLYLTLAAANEAAAGGAE